MKPIQLKELKSNDRFWWGCTDEGKMKIANFLVVDVQALAQQWCEDFVSVVCLDNEDNARNFIPGKVYFFSNIMLVYKL